MVDAASGALGMMAGGFADAAIVNSLSSAFSGLTSVVWYLFPIHFLYGLITALYVVATFLLTKNHVAAMQHAQSIGWSVMRSVLYHKTIYVYSPTANVDSFIVGIIRQTPSGELVRMIPLFWEYENNTLTVWHARWIHRTHLAAVSVLAAEKLSKAPEGEVYASRLDYSKDKASWVGVTINRHFMSRQCKKLCSSILRTFAVQKCTGDYFPFCMLICGPPGLGKTYAVECLAAQRGINNVRLANLSESKFHSVPLSTILSTMMSSVTEPTVYAIDEIDQYLDSYIRTIYTKEQTAGTLKQTHEEFDKYHRTTALFALRNLLDRSVNAPCCIVLMTNSFDTIYRGLEMTHHNALDKRINRIEFHPCDRDDVIDYMTYLRECMSKDPSIAVSDAEYTEAVSLLTHCSIPYRDMVQRFQTNGYDFPQTAKLINQYYSADEPVVPVSVAAAVQSVTAATVELVDIVPAQVDATPKPIMSGKTTSRFDNKPVKYYCTKVNGKSNWIHNQQFSELYGVGMQVGDCEFGECSDTKHKCQMSDLIDYGLYLGKVNGVTVINEKPDRPTCENDAVDVLGDYHLCRRCANEVFADHEFLCEAQYLLGTAPCHSNDALCIDDTSPTDDSDDYRLCNDCAIKYHKAKGSDMCASCRNSGDHRVYDEDVEIWLCDSCHDSASYGAMCDYMFYHDGSPCSCDHMGGNRLAKGHGAYCDKHFSMVYGDPPTAYNKEEDNVEWTQQEAEIVTTFKDAIYRTMHNQKGIPVVKYAKEIPSTMLEKDPNIRHIVSLILAPDILSSKKDTINEQLLDRLDRYNRAKYFDP